VQHDNDCTVGLRFFFWSALVGFLPKDGSSCFCAHLYNLQLYEELTLALVCSQILLSRWINEYCFFKKNYYGRKHPWGLIISTECHLQPQRRMYREHFDIYGLRYSMLNATLYCSAHVWQFVQASVTNLPTNVQTSGLYHSENLLCALH
jgi:hypothetical protein